MKVLWYLNIYVRPMKSFVVSYEQYEIKKYVLSHALCETNQKFVGSGYHTLCETSQKHGMVWYIILMKN